MLAAANRSCARHFKLHPQPPFRNAPLTSADIGSDDGSPCVRQGGGGCSGVDVQVGWCTGESVQLHVVDVGTDTDL